MLASCPICRSKVRSLGRGPAKHPLFECRPCDHRFATASASELDALYGASYDGFREDPVFDQRAREFFRDHVTKLIPAGGAILDVGCGNGTVLRIAQELGFEARGVDFSKEAVDSCRVRGLTAEVADFTTMSFATSGYDLVTFWDVLEHLPDPASFIAAATRALKPGGWLLLKVPHHRWLSIRLAATLPRLSSALLWTPGHLQFFSEKSLGRVLGDGFGEIRWVPSPQMRGIATDGSLGRRARRRIIQSVRKASGDGTLLALAPRL